MKAIQILGLAYGDEGKGATVDFLCRRLPVDLVVRFNGGGQAAHNVVTPEGVHHTFSQFGSGMLAEPQVRTHLSRFMLVDPLAMMNEGATLGLYAHQVWHRTTVDPRCVVVTPFHKRLNRWREMGRGPERHGSCGMGVGAARELHLKYGDEGTLLAGDLLDFDVARKKLVFLLGVIMKETGREEFAGFSKSDLLDLVIDYHKWAALVAFSETLPSSELAVFEGAQGALLDEEHGVEPHRTWTDCTFGNADRLLDEAGARGEDRLRIGCLRTYLTRHGAGPFDAFDSGYLIPEDHNYYNEWQGSFRIGPMDYGLAKRALRMVGGVDLLALSHLDKTAFPAAAASQMQGELGAPVGVKANGPTASDREFTPAWTEAAARWAGLASEEASR